MKIMYKKKSVRRYILLLNSLSRENILKGLKNIMIDNKYLQYQQAFFPKKVYAHYKGELAFYGP